MGLKIKLNGILQSFDSPSKSLQYHTLPSVAILNLHHSLKMVISIFFNTYIFFPI